MKHSQKYLKLWQVLLLSSLLGLSACNSELEEGEGQTPPDPTPPTTPPAPPTDPEPPTKGTWANKDEDGDGVLDEQDDYPFDSELSQYPLFVEDSFNDNPEVATEVDSDIPFKISGAIEEAGDGDVYKIDISQSVVENSEPVTFLTTMTDFRFKPTVSILDSSGFAIREIKNNSEALGYTSEISTVMFTTPGTYYIAIAEKNLNGSVNATYSIKAFVDSDFDALPQPIELALDIKADDPDSDRDGVYDGNEVFIYNFGKVDLDVDSDDIPNWLDEDSDGDGLTDSFEMLSDPDKDGAGSFADLDSDGNTINDATEAVSIESPVDTDRDSLPDFLDLDDDSDRVLDTLDADRTVKASLTDDYVVYATRYQDNIGIELVDRAFPGSRVTIQGKDFPLNSMFLVINSQNNTFNITPEDVTNNSATFYIPEDVNIETEYEYFITNGETRSNSKYVEISSPLTPLISELSEGSYRAGETLTINGKNLDSSSSVHFGSIVVEPESVLETSLTVIIPDEAISGFISIESLQLKSNEIYIQINNSVKVNNATSEFDMYLSDAQGKFHQLTKNGITLEYKKQKISTVSLLQKRGEFFEPFGQLAILPDEKQIDLSPQRLALTDLVLTGAISDSQRLNESQLKFIATEYIKKNKVYESNIEQSIDITRFYFDNLTEYRHQEQTTLNSTSDGSIKPTVNPPESYWDEISISPTRKAFQEEWYKALEYDGYMEVQNRSQLLLSLGVHPMNKDLEKGEGYVTDKDGKTYNHIQDMFDRDIIGAQYLQIFGIDLWSQDVTSKACPYTDCVYTVLSPGYSEPYANEPDHVRIRSHLYIRSVIERGIWPSIKLTLDIAGLSNRFPKGPMTKLKTGQNVIDIIFSHGFNDIDFIRDTVEEAQKKGDWSQAIEALVWGRVKLMLDTESNALVEGKTGPILNLILQQLEIDPVNIGELILKEAATRLIPIIGEVKIIWDILKGIDSATDIGKFWWDLNKVGAQYDFYVNWGMKIISLNPGLVAAEDESVQLTIRGAGFKPIDNWWPWPDEEPLVRLYDQGRDDLSREIERYSVNEFGTELKVTIPGEFLKGAVGDIRVEVEHRDQVVSSIDYSTPKTIRVGTGFDVDKLYPDAGYHGDLLTLKGIGFDNKTEVWFQSNSGQQRATLTQVTSNTIKLVVPNNAITGNVTVKKESQSIFTPFTLLTNEVLIKFGDNGNLADDKYALWIDNNQSGLMTTGARVVDIEQALQPGRYTVELKGIEAPDDIGTYYICFSNNVSVNPGSNSLAGRDLVRDSTKQFYVEVTESSRPEITTCAYVNLNSNKVKVLQNAE